MIKMTGRGALENPTGRFEKIEVVSDPEWALPDGVPTVFLKDNTQEIVATNDSPDVGFDASVNPYRGCEHGCIYCFARPTHEYLGMSCGLDFESKILVKMEAPALLRKKLSSKSWKPQVVLMSGVTDCYQPIERKLKLTRQCLEVLAEFRNPVGIITKNHLITRDMDVLQELARFKGVRVIISLTTLDESLRHVMEPRASTPQLRLEAIQKLSAAGVPVGVMMGPIIPGLTDHEIDAVLKNAAAAGAKFAHYTVLRLPYGVKDLFQTWLQTHYPDRKNKVLNHLRDMRDGKLNNPEFGRRMRGEGEYAEVISQLFTLSKKRHGLDKSDVSLSIKSFRCPGEGKQLSLL